jgi:hypothetical protein
MGKNPEGSWMAEKLDPKQTTSPEELLLSMIYTQEALVNLLVIHDPVLAKQYTENWEKHKGHSDVYQGR